eukprot:760685-Hanusia_phi.AAC.4
MIGFFALTLNSCIAEAHVEASSLRASPLPVPSSSFLHHPSGMRARALIRDKSASKGFGMLDSYTGQGWGRGDVNDPVGGYFELGENLMSSSKSLGLNARDSAELRRQPLSSIRRDAKKIPEKSSVSTQDDARARNHDTPKEVLPSEWDSSTHLQSFGEANDHYDDNEEFLVEDFAAASAKVSQCYDDVYSDRMSPKSQMHEEEKPFDTDRYEISQDKAENRKFKGYLAARAEQGKRRVHSAVKIQRWYRSILSNVQKECRASIKLLLKERLHKQESVKNECDSRARQKEEGRKRNSTDRFEKQKQEREVQVERALMKLKAEMKLDFDKAEELDAKIPIQDEESKNKPRSSSNQSLEKITSSNRSLNASKDKEFNIVDDQTEIQHEYKDDDDSFSLGNASIHDNERPLSQSSSPLKQENIVNPDATLQSASSILGEPSEKAEFSQELSASLMDTKQHETTISFSDDKHHTDPQDDTNCRKMRTVDEYQSGYQLKSDELDREIDDLRCSILSYLDSVDQDTTIHDSQDFNLSVPSSPANKTTLKVQPSLHEPAYSPKRPVTDITRSPSNISKETHNLSCNQSNLANQVYSEVKAKMSSMKVELHQNQMTIQELKSSLERQKEVERMLKEEHQKNIQSQLSLQREEYENQIKRQLSFIEQLVNDKEGLSSKCEDMANEFSLLKKRYDDNVKELENKHERNLKKQRESIMVSEKIRRENWMQEKSKEIKELTVDINLNEYVISNFSVTFVR